MDHKAIKVTLFPAILALQANFYPGEPMADRPPFADVTWQRACNGGNCVEVAYQDGWVGVRDGKQGDASPVLAFTAEEWGDFLRGVRDGGFDLP
ncbi:hypothetical protein GCM10009530_16250 [Microbispora corallina]|uniref:DUF397 domain-containing protein n=1 Tax=Microbispora corallina TaxID=83302 RepID=A0ABQ4FXQ9_9ACTN|nr:DUF397 domain-containing protein [Microbispora corallina]GIH39584.1 hypothetical protein Mco01_25840 [Microbispora corallina]